VHHSCRLAIDLCVGEAAEDESLRVEIELPRPIILKRLAALMGGVCVGFNDEPGGRPEEVDGERADPCVDERFGKAVAAAELQEGPFELAPGAVGGDLAEVELEKLGLASGLAVETG
jgi:hypothetical protein